MFNTQSDSPLSNGTGVDGCNQGTDIQPSHTKTPQHNYISQNYRMPFSHVGTCSGDTIHTSITLLTITRILNNIRKFSHTKTRLISMIFKPIYVLDTITKKT